MIFTFYILHFTFLTPVYAACTPGTSPVNIGDCFGFGDITSLGAGTSKIVPFIFSAAAFLVIFYFLMGAFQYLRAGGNKEEVEKGRQMITHSFIGFILLMLTFLVIQYVLTGIFGEGAVGIVNIFKK